jgi:hypothetical protein
VESLEERLTPAQRLWVSTLNDDGAGTLRAAIQQV